MVNFWLGLSGWRLVNTKLMAWSTCAQRAQGKFCSWGEGVHSVNFRNWWSLIKYLTTCLLLFWTGVPCTSQRVSSVHSPHTGQARATLWWEGLLMSVTNCCQLEVAVTKAGGLFGATTYPHTRKIPPSATCGPRATPQTLQLTQQNIQL